MTTSQIHETMSTTVLLVLFTLAFIGCGKAEKDASGKGVERGSAAEIVPVEVSVAVQKDLIVTKTYSGTLEGEEQANIVAKISERVTGIKARVGESVGANKVIITLDKSGAQSQYYQAEATFKNSEKTLERMKSLFAEGAISQQSLDGAQTAYDVAKANYDAARSAVDLWTPIAGVVTAVNVNNGDLATPGAVLATIARIDKMKVTCNINETDVVNLALGQKVKVFMESRPEAQVDGQIVQLSKSADIRSRTFEIKALFINTPDRWFKPGLFCKVNVQISPREKSLVVPTLAVQSDGTTNMLYVVRNGRAYQKVVHAGMTDGQHIAILEGIAVGDTVATIGVTNLRDSSYVNIVSRSN
jgi:membrane fusion protein (multidrug efflux system)